MDETGVVVEEYTSLISEQDEPSSTAPSSPPPYKSALLSSDALDKGNNTPPSSPPPRLASPLARARKPAFSFLKRKRDAAATESCPRASVGPLEEITNSVPGRGRPAKKVRLTQMQIDLGGEVRTACKICGMEYIPSHAQDAALHKEFHIANVGGVDVGKAFLKRYGSSVVWESSKDATVGEGRAQGFVMVVNRRSSKAEKNKARRILKVVNMELSAVDIEDERLWSQTVIPDTNGRGKDCLDGTVPAPAGEETRESCGDRFKVFLFVCGEKCIGLCLAERISEAHEVESQNDEADPNKSNLAMSKSSSISVSSNTKPSILGISRIWTSVSYRRKGVAATLLDVVRRNFIYGVHIPKDMVAFSQPTESGGLLAQKWFDDGQRWHVYVVN